MAQKRKARKGKARKTKIRILINVSPLTNHYYHRGVGNFTYSFIKKIFESNQNTYEWVLMGFGSKTEVIEKLNVNTDLKITNFEYISLGNSNTFLEKISAPLFYFFKLKKAIKSSQADVFLNLQPEHHVSMNIPTILVVHDIIPFKTGVFSQKNKLANFIKKINFNWIFKRFKKARKIIVPSDFTKRMLINEGIDKIKIKKIYFAPAQNFQEVLQKSKKDFKEDSIKLRTLNTYNITQPFVFYLGGLEKNKNVETLIKSFALISDKYPHLKLVIGGGEFKLGWDNKAYPKNNRAQKIYNLVQDLKIRHKVVFAGYIDEKHLPIIYYSAELFIHLSKIEGFGLNVLEPQLVGIPVIASDSSTYPEILADSALLVDPDNINQISAQIDRLLAKNQESMELKKQLKKKGVENVKRFSWEMFRDNVFVLIDEIFQNKNLYKNLEKKNMSIKNSQNLQKLNLRKKEKKSKFNILNQTKKAVVLALYFDPFKGGMEKVAYDYAKFLSDEGYDVVVITSDRKGKLIVKQKQEMIDGIKVIRLQKKGENYYFNFLKGLYKELKTINPDLIHMHGFGFFGFDQALIRYKIVQKLFKNSQKPTTYFINTPHGPFMAKQEKGIRKLIKIIWTFIQSIYVNRLYNLVIADNPEQHIWMQKKYKIEKNKIFLSEPVVPEPKKSFTLIKETQDIAKLKNKNKKNHKEVIISTITRLADYKGLEDIVLSFSEINSTIPTKLYIAGADDNFTKTIRKQISLSSRKEDIMFETDISEKRKYEILEKSDIFILASKWEAFGISIGEAMAYANAIITTNTEGGRHLVENGKNGFIFEYKDVRMLTKSIDTLINDQKTLRKMQKNSLEKVKQFSKAKIKAKFMKNI